MIKVKVDELKTGDIIAEHIINSEKQVLLSAGTVLSRKTITLLKLWEIKAIKLREETDSDDAIRLSLQFDEIVYNNSHLFDNLKPPQEIIESKKFPVVLSSIISENSLRQYDDMSCKISELFINIQNSKNIMPLTEMSNVIHEYVVTTPCVIGYTLKREFKNIRHENLIDHSMSVAIVSGKIAKLLGYPPGTVQTIIFGALIHDIGKIKLPAKITNRSGHVAPEDEELYQSHVQVGYDLIKSLGLPRDVNLTLTQHHEYNDGSGFPLHLKAEKIHPYAQIVAFADMFDTLVHEQNGLPNFFDIRSKLITNGANKIREQIIDVFDHYLKDFIFNVNVELNDGRTAEVIYTHPSYMSLVVRTTDGDFVDLSKNKDLWITKSFL
ncbi:HD-GYP domain-containing protein [Pelosinus sp. sgz500959]|uniref:HD-GYP domain-containing protein n=1 Tax=Pelosinus sp. sgz500959 TaxID=3242472 RepID=UPI00366DE120